MKLFVISDIHGSVFYAKKALELAEKEKADRILLLGDLLYHGPRNDLPRDYSPKTVAELLNSAKNKIIAVRGNCDAEVDQMVLDFPISADYALVSTEKADIFATHGHLFDENKMPPLKTGDVLMYGHFHVPMCGEKNGVYIINPGSVSIPKENSPHSCMTVENGTFKWLDTDGEAYKEFTI